MDCAALQDALIDVVERHQSLRTIFPEQAGAAQQLILDKEATKPVLHVHQIEKGRLNDQLNKAVRYCFNLSEEPAFRVELLK